MVMDFLMVDQVIYFLTNVANKLWKSLPDSNTLGYWTNIQFMMKMMHCEYGDRFSSRSLGDLLSYILMFPISYGKACQIQMIQLIAPTSELCRKWSVVNTVMDFLVVDQCCEQLWKCLPDSNTIAYWTNIQVMKK